MTPSQLYCEPSRNIGKCVLGVPVAFLFLAQFCLVPATAQNPVPRSFRVSIEISDGDKVDAAPLDRHLVLFHEGRIYDFAQTPPHDVTVIDPVKGEVTLLSRKEQIQSTVSTSQMVDVASRVRLDAKERKKEAVLGLDAVVKKSGDTYTLEFDRYRYECHVSQPKVPEFAHQFAEFTDWAARVNLIREMGPPPFGRMTLGRQVASEGLVPDNLKLTCHSEQINRSFQSRYLIDDELQATDEKRISEVASMAALYRHVPLKSFPR